jgi:hypothetical protein
MIDLWLTQAQHLSWAQLAALFVLTWAALSGLIWLWLTKGGNDV